MPPQQWADVAIQAFETLAPRFLNWSLFRHRRTMYSIAPSSRSAQEPEYQSASLSYSDGITFAGLRSAAVSSYPSTIDLNPSSRFSKSCKRVPVVTTDVETTVIVRDTGPRFARPTRLPTALVAAIESMLNDARCRPLAANARVGGANCRYDAYRAVPAALSSFVRAATAPAARGLRIVSGGSRMVARNMGWTSWALVYPC
jgi:hypothetical protein